jgi:hypothetical protein
VDRETQLPNVHDFVIESIRLEVATQSLCIELHEEGDSTPYLLTIGGVTKCSLFNWRAQNVIFRICVFTKREASHAYVRACELLELDIDWQSTKDEVFVFYLEPSVGTEIASVGASWTFGSSADDS